MVLKRQLRILCLIVLVVCQTASAKPFRRLNSSEPGERFEVKDYLSKSSLNVIVLYSEASPASQGFLKNLEELCRIDQDLEVGILSVDRKNMQEIDWKSPLSREYALNSVPHVLVYKDKQLILQGHEARKFLLKRYDKARQR